MLFFDTSSAWTNQGQCTAGYAIHCFGGAINVSFVCSDHETGKSRILRRVAKESSRVFTLNIRQTDCSLFKEWIQLNRRQL